MLPYNGEFNMLPLPVMHVIVIQSTFAQLRSTFHFDQGESQIPS